MHTSEHEVNPCTVDQKAQPAGIAASSSNRSGGASGSATTRFRPPSNAGDVARALSDLSDADRSAYVKAHRKQIKEFLDADRMQLDATKRSVKGFAIIFVGMCVVWWLLKHFKLLEEV